MTEPARVPSPRHDELLERAYQYALDHGIADLSLRPLAAEIGSSPRVLLFLFGSKEGLIRALLAHARKEQLAALDNLRRDAGITDLAAAMHATWAWLAAEAHRPLLTLWLDAYARSLTEPGGPWEGFARQTVNDWLDVLATVQKPASSAPDGAAERTLALAVLRGALLDLLATGDTERTTAAITAHLALSGPPRTSRRPR